MRMGERTAEAYQGKSKMSSRRDIQLPLRILARIQEHTREHPITYKTLAEEFQVDWRKVAEIVLELVDAGHKIGTSKTKPLGCFLAKDPAELLDTIERLRTEARKMFARSNRLADWGHTQPTVFEQLADVNEAIS